jgi:hypothetical protein
MNPLAPPVLRHGTIALIVGILAAAALPGRVDAQSLGERLRQTRDQLRERAEARASEPGAMPTGCSKNDTRQCARLIPLETPVDGAIGVNNLTQFYRFSIDSPGIMQFALAPMPNRQRVRLTVTDAQEQRLGQFEFPYGQPGERILQLVAPGTYFVQLNSLDGQPEERFSLMVKSTSALAAGSSVAVPSGCYQNDTFQCALNIPLGSTVQSTVGTNGMTLFFRFSVENPGIMQFALSPMPNRQRIRLTVTDAQYQEIAEHNYQPGQPGERTSRITAPGIYFVQLRSLDGQPDERIGLTVSHAPDAAPTTAAPGCSRNDTYQCAEAMALATRVEGVIGGSHRDLYHRFTVTQPGVYRFALNPMPNAVNVQLTVADADYNQLERFTFERGKPGAREVRIATPGTYYVRTFATGAGAAERFTLQVSRAAP